MQKLLTRLQKQRDVRAWAWENIAQKDSRPQNKFVSEAARVTTQNIGIKCSRLFWSDWFTLEQTSK